MTLYASDYGYHSPQACIACGSYEAPDCCDGKVKSLTRARLIVRNRDAYPRQLVRDAAVFLLGSLSASPEDVHDATWALA